MLMWGREDVALPFSAGQQSPVQSPGKVLGPVPIGQRRVFLLQECMLVSNGVSHRLLVVDVQLAPANSNTLLVHISYINKTQKRSHILVIFFYLRFQCEQSYDG